MAKIRPQASIDKDESIPIRQFAGTDQSTLPNFLDPSMLQVSQNWCPIDVTFLLSKRRGTLPYITSANNARIDRMIAVLSQAGNRYLVFSKQNTSTGKDEVWFSKNDAAEVQVVGGTFPTGGNGRRIGMTWLNNNVYASNGVDPVFEIPLSDPLTATALSAPALLTDTGQAIAFTTDATSTLPSGTVSYRWAIYNTVSQLYVSIGPVHPGSTDPTGYAQTPLATTVRADFTAPSGALGANQQYHLFVAPVNQEIEGAHLQTPSGLPASGTFTLRNDASIDGVPVPIPSTLTRTGNILSNHLSRVILAGNLSDPLGMFCTDVLAPFLEQSIFNQGTFFPANGRFQAPSIVTGVAVGSLSAQPESPDSPLLVFTAVTTTGFFADLVDDPSLRIRTLSKRIGCVAHGSIAYTTLGPMWCGQQSVYLYSPSQLEPVDVGWPIWPIIRQIPRASRSFVEATFHKGFYKLAIPIPGSTQLVQQWWLDLRRGLGDTSSGFASAPAWFGPMVGLNVTTFAQSFFDPAEDDRGWAVVDGGPTQTTATILLIDQANVYQDNGLNIASQFRTARLDDGTPFTRKSVTRVRVIARVNGAASLTCEIDAIGQTLATTPAPQTQGIIDTAIGTITLQGIQGDNFATVDDVTTTTSGSSATVINVANAAGVAANDWLTVYPTVPPAPFTAVSRGTVQVQSVAGNAITLVGALPGGAPAAGEVVASQQNNTGGVFASVDASTTTLSLVGTTTTFLFLANAATIMPGDWLTVIPIGESQVLKADYVHSTVTLRIPLPSVPVNGSTVISSPDGQGAQFNATIDTEGQFIPAPKRPRGQAIEVVLSHSDPVQVDLRDMEVDYQPARGVA